MNETSPVADLVVEGGSRVGEVAVLDGSRSSAPTGTLKRYVFDPGDGSEPISSKESVVEHSYTDPGDYTATLTVYDNRKKSATDSQVVPVLPAEDPVPEPVDCVLGESRFDSLISDWTPCVSGKQTRQEKWVRDVLVEPANGGAACGAREEVRVIERDCTVSPDPEPVPEPDPDPTPMKYVYYTFCATDPGRVAAYHFRTQQNINSIPSRAEGPTKIPVVYDAAKDAALFQIDPSGSLANSGSTGTPQKRMPIGLQGEGLSMWLSWDLIISASMAWKPDTEMRVVNGETVKVTYLDQHKSHRLDDRGASPWIGMKQNYAKAGNRGLGVAEFFFSATTQYMGPGTRRGASETIARDNGMGGYIMPPEFYLQPDTVSRVMIYVEGNFGAGDRACRLSVWLADVNREPVQIYDRINMVTPETGVGLFRFEFDSSKKVALNGPGEQWQRNYVVVKGLTYEQLGAFIARPEA